jgi:hypothetical protein
MPSKHVNAATLIRRGLYDDLHSFVELEQRISMLGDENTKIVGDALEVFTFHLAAVQMYPDLQRYQITIFTRRD